MNYNTKHIHTYVLNFIDGFWYCNVCGHKMGDPE